MMLWIACCNDPAAPLKVQLFGSFEPTQVCFQINLLCWMISPHFWPLTRQNNYVTKCDVQCDQDFVSMVLQMNHMPRWKESWRLVIQNTDDPLKRSEPQTGLTLTGCQQSSCAAWEEANIIIMITLLLFVCVCVCFAGGWGNIYKLSCMRPAVGFSPTKR